MRKSISACFLWFVVWGCKAESPGKITDSQLEAMSDKSWFRSEKGIDRFYLAYPEFPGEVGGGPERNGWEILVGLGCYGEDPHPAANVHNPSTGGQIALNRRQRLNEFPLTESNHPTNGQCKIILGSPNASSTWHIKSDQDVFKRARNTFMMATASCIGLATAVTSASLAVAGAGAGAAVSGGATVVGLAAVSQMMWAGITASSLFCGAGISNATIISRQVRANKAYDNLLDALGKSEIRAYEAMALRQTVKGVSDLKRAQALLGDQGKTPEKIMKAAAIFNPYYVYAFNHDIDAKMEQGWGNGEDFFNAVRALKKSFKNSLSPVE